MSDVDYYSILKARIDDKKTVVFRKKTEYRGNDEVLYFPVKIFDSIMFFYSTGYLGTTQIPLSNYEHRALVSLMEVKLERQIKKEDEEILVGLGGLNE